MNRRDFLKGSLLQASLLNLGLLAGGAGLPHSALAAAPGSTALRKARVIVIGGGFAGATLAKYLRLWSQQQLEVLVFEPQPWFVSCPLSNLVLGGSRSIADLSFSYDLLQARHGIQWIREAVTAIDPEKFQVKTSSASWHYDRLVLASGIALDYSAISGMRAEDAETIPHAWKAGAQTQLLHAQLQAMPDGGVFVITIPKAPYRCPPGPYERICQVAHYFSREKPASKILVLDANPEIVSKKGLFSKIWQERYPGMIDYRPDTAIQTVDVASRQVHTEFERIKADVLNIIPPQQAHALARQIAASPASSSWCAVDFRNYASKTQSAIHVIGDGVASNLPKSAHMATSQAKVCASAIIAELQDMPPDPVPVFANTCYSFVDDRMAAHVAHVYRYQPDKQMMVAAEGGGVSAMASLIEGSYAQAWAQNIWSDTLT